MSSRDNPYARVDPLGEFMRGWQSIETIKRQGEDRKDREENREYVRGRREREVTLDSRADTTWDQQQGEFQANAPVRAAQRTAAVALAEGTIDRVQHEKGARQYEVAGRLTPEQQKRANQLSLEASEGTVRQQGATLENTRASAADTREVTRGRKTQNDVYDEWLALNEQIASLDSPQIKALENPAYRQQAMELYEGFMSGKGLAAPDKLYGFMNDTFATELSTGIGDKVSGSDDVITGKRITALYEDPANPENVLIELDVQARRKDGSIYAYEAPVTKNRKSDDTDEVLSLPKAKMMERLEGIVGASLDVEQGASIEDMRKQLIARRDALAGVAAKGGRRGGGTGETAYERNARFVAEHRFGGTSSGQIKEALDWIKGKGAQTQVMELTKMLATQQKQDLEDRRIKRDQVLTTDQLMQRAVEMQSSLAGGVPKESDPELDATANAAQSAATSGGGGATSSVTLVGRTPDGKDVYEDAEGNQFVEE